MEFNFKNLLTEEKKILWIFDGLVIISAAFWLFWFYNVSFKSVSAPGPEAGRPSIELDQPAYQATKKYLDSIKNYKLPEINYQNPEPFKEY